MFFFNYVFLKSFHINWYGIPQGTLSWGLLHALVLRGCIENKYHAIL
jgi:hypothetical protein